ncbi:VC0807 family protein [Kocuria carniphila]|uniref:VC0807 family protein n=1 Tax=Kocuria carniphila TaxID=262208 RepID=UPI0034CD733D
MKRVAKPPPVNRQSPVVDHQPPTPDKPPPDKLPAQERSTGQVPPEKRKRAVAGMIGIDLVLPFAIYYGLRLAGADPWLALMLGAVGPLVRIAVTTVRTRRIDRLGVFTLSVLAIGTAVGMFSADPRILLARESWLTALIGFWILISLAGRRPILFEATIAVMPADAATQWEHDWGTNPFFRKIFRTMTLAWGIAFILDAVARVIMAYTLPIDVVPIASIGLLLVMLFAIVYGTKFYAGRKLAADGPQQSSSAETRGAL